MAKFITPKQAAGLINDGDVVVFSVDMLRGYPNELFDAVRQRFIDEGHPRNLTTIRAAGFGSHAEDDLAEGAWCLEGLLKRSISSYIAACPKLKQAVEQEKIQAYMFPMGAVLQMFTETGRGMPGVLTKIGLNTFVDARYDGGKCNKLTLEEGEDLVEYIPDFMGEEYLYYKSPGMNVALLRGTTADKHGNISDEKEMMSLETAEVALAVKSSGGIVIVQVEKITDVYDIHARHVKVPGTFVDYVVAAEHPDDVMQTAGRWHQKDYNYSFTGDEIVNLDTNSGEPLPLDERKLIARRTAMEISAGSTANFGIGMPQIIPSIMLESGGSAIMGSIIPISETGVIGGKPAVGRDFGSHWNPEVLFNHAAHFSWFDGGNLDIAVFGLGEADGEGDMNTSHLNGRITGIGGFTDISTMSKKLVFMGTFTAVGLEVEIKNNRINILKEGKYKKFVKKCRKRTFVAKEYLKNHDSFLIITERCVIECSNAGLTLIEVAPGIDIQTQILDQCECDLLIPSDGVRLMDESIFTENSFRL